MQKNAQYAVSGALAGLANGFFGAGGGLLLVPLLTRWAGLAPRRALPTSVAIILPLCLVSAAIYYLKGALSLGGALPYLLGGAAGGLLAGRVFKKVPLTLLRRVFGAFILYGGVRALLLL